MRRHPKTAPRKLVCLETYWGDHQRRMFRTPSVLPFFEGLAQQLEPELRIAHRFMDSPAQLAAYTKYRKGLLWRDPESFDTPVYYLSFHGAPGRIRTALTAIGPEALCRAFANWGAHPNLVYFGACSVFRGKRGEHFARAFLKRSGCRAIVGYATDVNWMDSMLTDLLFLRRFYADPAPWRNLRRIHASVLADFAPARALGHVLHIRAR
ncbi:MAG: hypothetical protein ACRD3R_11910 [Terriglobales bacterium]